MRIALIGADADLLSLARAIARSTDHALVWFAEPGEAADELHALAPQAVLTDDWESLIAGSVAELVLVARPDATRAEDEERRAEQLRKLVGAAVPLVVGHPAQRSMIVCYELEMIRHDTRSLVFPYLPWRWHPAVDRLRALAESTADGPLGEWEQIVIERRVSARSDAVVQAAFARDADLARLLAGDLTRLAALAPGGASDRLANLGVQLSGPDGILVRWSVGPVEPVGGGRLTVAAARGRAVLDMPADERAWALAIQPTDGAEQVERFEDYDAAAVSLARIAAAYVAAERGEATSPAWTDAARAVELTETIDRSLERGRTIELYQEEYSEETTFKGKMAALGCFMLIAALGMLVLAASASALPLTEEWHQTISGIWPVALLVFLGLFLLLQLLRFAFPRPDEEDSPGRRRPP